MSLYPAKSAERREIPLNGKQLIRLPTARRTTRDRGFASFLHM